MNLLQPFAFQLLAYAVDSAGKIAKFGSSITSESRKGLSIIPMGVARFATSGTVKFSSGQVAVNLWTIGPQGGSGSIMSAGEMGPYPGDVTGTALASLQPGGVVLAAREDAKLRLFPMEYHQRFKDDNGN